MALGGGKYFPRSVIGGSGYGGRLRYSPSSFRATNDSSVGVAISRHRLFGNFVDNTNSIKETGNSLDSSNQTATYTVSVSETCNAQDINNFKPILGQANPRSIIGASGYGGRLRYSPSSFRSVDNGSVGVAISRHRLFGNFVDNTNSITETGNCSDIPVAGRSFAVSSITESGNASDIASEVDISTNSVAESGNATASLIANALFNPPQNLEIGNGVDSSNAQNSIFIGLVYEVGSSQESDLGEEDNDLSLSLENSSGGYISLEEVQGNTQDLPSSTVIFSCAITEITNCQDYVSNNAIFVSFTAEAGNTVDTESTYDSAFVGVVVENGNGIDSANTYAAFTSSSSENGNGIDSANTYAAFTSSSSENGNGIDSANTYAAFTSSSSENGNGIDSANTYAAFTSSSSENGNGIDSANTYAAFTSSSSENGNGIDSANTYAAFTSSSSENGNGIDSANTYAAFTSSSSENGNGIDSISQTHTLHLLLLPLKTEMALIRFRLVLYLFLSQQKPETQ